MIAELTNQLTHEGQRVLIASQTNLAVDNALGRLKSKTNVRPVRHLGHFAAQDPDPESEPFLENNVVESFFLPSVRDECAKAQERALKLSAESELLSAFSEAEGLVGQVNQFKRQRKEVEQTKQKFALQRLEIERATQEEENQKRLVARALSNIDEGRWNDVNFSELQDAAPFRSLLNAVQEGLASRERLPLLHQAILTLNDVSGEGAVSEEVGELRAAAVDKAAEERDFEAASKLQKQLKLLEETQREEGNPQWADDTRNMARLGNKLNNQNLISMAQQRTPPENFSQWRVERVAEFESEIQIIQQEEKALTTNGRIERSSDLPIDLDNVQAVPLNGLDQAGKEANEQLVMLERKHTDALRNYAELVQCSLRWKFQSRMALMTQAL